VCLSGIERCPAPYPSARSRSSPSGSPTRPPQGPTALVRRVSCAMPASLRHWAAQYGDAQEQQLVREASGSLLVGFADYEDAIDALKTDAAQIGQLDCSHSFSKPVNSLADGTDARHQGFREPAPGPPPGLLAQRRRGVAAPVTVVVGHCPRGI
jgi:hypothetical protein